MEGEKFKLSNQAMGTFMMTLQKCLMQQADITGILQDLDFYVSKDNEIVCLNPPTLEVDHSDEDLDDDYDFEESDILEEMDPEYFTKIED
jgi:hypothetical protein